MMDILHDPDEHNNILLGDVAAINVNNSVIYSQSRFVTVLDIDHIVVVETPDAILVCSKEKAQNVKQVVDYLKEQGREELL